MASSIWSFRSSFLYAWSIIHCVLVVPFSCCVFECLPDVRDKYNLGSNLSLNMQHDISLALYVLPHVLTCLLRRGSPAVLKEVRKYMYVYTCVVCITCCTAEI